MFSKLLGIVFCLLSLLSFRESSVGATTLSKVTKFEHYVKLLPQLKSPTEKLRVFEAVWAEIRVDYHKDRNKLSEFYQQLGTFVEATNADVYQQAIAEFQTQVRTFIQKQEARSLTNFLGKLKINSEDFLVEHVLKLLASYDFTMVKQIFKMAIDEIYNKKPTEILSKELLLIYQKDDRITFELALELQIYLFSKFLKQGDVNDVYKFELAYNFLKLSEDQMFQLIDRDLRRRLNSAIDKLPDSLIHLFFRPTFCLTNKLYIFQLYLSLDIIYDVNRRGAFVYVDETLNKKLPVWATQITEEGELSFQFLNIYFQQYLYLDAKINNQTNILAGWQAVTEPINSNWKVELWDDALVISQSGLVACADKTFYDSYRRFVFGVDAESVNIQSREDCQWLARECS